MERSKMVELLAPAGSVAAMKAAFAAGADAVYIGGQQFGARAYADNLSSEELVDAINYAHLRGKQLYLTVNTLLKPAELYEQLFPYLRPLYEAGLDAVIVQDLGVFASIREWFPDLAVHVSTQMGITGPKSAAAFQKQGAKRVVLARELDLTEVTAVHESCPGLEIECFVHGALCYSYSGHCLFSSLAGGRSGNRGRCAQPCRMAYCALTENGTRLAGQQDGYVLSPKELCSLDLLPQILKAGVNSLKIEGRMKKPEYTAGVCAIYRKYIDLYLEKGSKGYRVAEEDRQLLMDLFQRVGFTDGYWKRHNGREMMTLLKPIFRTENECWNKEIREKYLERELQVPITVTASLFPDAPAYLELSYEDLTVGVEGEFVEKAQNRPTTEEQIKKQLSKMGGSAFYPEEIRIWMDESVFLPVSTLNALRRNAIEKLEAAIEERYQRTRSETDGRETKLHQQKTTRDDAREHFAVLVTTEEQLMQAAECGWITEFYIESSLLIKEGVSILKSLAGPERSVYMVLPHMFRENQRKKIQELWERVKDRVQGVMVRNVEGLYWAKEQVISRIVTDAGVYTFQDKSREFLMQQGIAKDTVPLELNQKELRERGLEDSMMIAYGHAPMMITANCVKKTLAVCDGRSDEKLQLKDRRNNVFEIRTFCEYCYNVIYNFLPVSLHERLQELSKEANGRITWRLDFTVENKETAKKILDFYERLWKEGVPGEADFAFTRGHLKRGVE